MREVMEVLATQSIDDVLGSGRDAINQELYRRITKRFASMSIDPVTGKPRGAGVRILFVGILGAHPPHNKQVAESFEYVVLAEQRRRADIEMAQANAIDTLASVAGDADRAKQIVSELDELEQETAVGASEESLTQRRVRIASLIDAAGGEAAGLLFRASADRWVRQMDFKGRAARQKGRLAIYRAAPEVYLAGLYLQALRESVRNSRLFITTFDSPNVTLNFDQVEATFENLLDETRAEQ
jgi:regulator of protease activity HflC (stomatin/prohibitin superfamily)